nr:hypothetical protein CFP56_06079 [Quercus suber]
MRAEVVGVLLKPFVSVVGKSRDKVLCNKIKGLSQQNLVPRAVTKGNGVQGQELWKKKSEISDHTHRIMEISEGNLTFQKQQQWRLRVTHKSKRRLREMREKK